MPPIRSTPVRSRYAATIDDEEDDGFNPAWAQKPNTPPPALTQPEPVVQEESPKKLPPPNVVVTHLSTNSPSYDNGAELDGVTLGLLLPLAFVYNTVRGVAGVAGGVIQAGYRGTKAVRGTIARVEGAVRKVFPGRYDPMRGRKPKTPVKKTPKDSLLALPPHMVGATPNVVRQSRGERLRGQPGEHTPTTEEARAWALFHATPLPKKPKPAPETPLPNTGPSTPWKTPKFEFNTPQRKMKIGKTKEFAMNVHKGDFKDWLRLLKKHGVGTTALRRELNENLAFPTDLILLLHNQKGNGQSRGFDSLVKCFSHEGFTTHYKILVPILKNPAPLKFRQGEVEAIDINAVHQQADGCCRFCRGFSWAGQVEVREINKGEDVPCRSLHRSLVQYTAEEKAEFTQNKYDMLFRRWCRESRYDWIFDTPKPSGWEIPKDDPRLRHISMVKQQHKATYGAPKMYNGDLVAGYNQRRTDLTKQDIAAKILIDGVRKENPVLAATYEKMDLERKRRQVKTDWLCVKQVKIVLKEPASKRKAAEANSNNHKRSKDDSSHQPTPEKPAKRVKFASQPAGPTINGQKTPAKGILKTTSSSVNKLKKTPQSRKKSAFKKARTAFSVGATDDAITGGSSHGLLLLSDAHQPEAKASGAPLFQFNASLTHRSSSQSQPHSLTHKQPQLLPESRNEIPSSKLAASVPVPQTNSQINFSAVPALPYQAPRPQSNQVFFYGALSKSTTYDGHLPPSFDPTVIRRQYNTSVANAGDYWDNLKPYGWKPDLNLTKEENDAERFNYNFQKLTEQQEREKELRAMEIAEENARKGVSGAAPAAPAAGNDENLLSVSHVASQADKIQKFSLEDRRRWRKSRTFGPVNRATKMMVEETRKDVRQIYQWIDKARRVYRDSPVQLANLLDYIKEPLREKLKQLPGGMFEAGPLFQDADIAREQHNCVKFAYFKAAKRAALNAIHVQYDLDGDLNMDDSFCI